MKYRIIGLCTVLLAALAVFAVSFSMPDENGRRYIQHADAEPKAPCLSCADGVGALCTHLPIVKIETGGLEIPGTPLNDAFGVKIGYTTAADGASTIAAWLEVIDQSGAYNHSADEPTLSGDIEIRKRGHSSRYFEKPNYFIRLVNADGSNRAQPLLGMDAHHEWALHGPILDRSLLRNYMWYNIAGQIMDYSPNVRFCELVINGEYRGLYLMTETITAGRDGARLSLEVSKKDNSFSGYLLRLDWGDSDPERQIHTLTDYTLVSASAHELVYPGAQNCTPELQESIKDDFSAFEKMLYSFDYDSKKHGYASRIDVDSFVDYVLINELTCNVDAGRYSTYIYKDIDGSYRMCVWDFNSACDNYQQEPLDIHAFHMQDTLWFSVLYKDQDFVERVIARYYELRESYFSEEYLFGFMDDTVAYLGSAIDRNNARWGFGIAEDKAMFFDEYRNPENYAEALQQIREFLGERIAFMDENIETLRQYCAESRVQKYSGITD